MLSAQKQTNVLGIEGVQHTVGSAQHVIILQVFGTSLDF